MRIDKKLCELNLVASRSQAQQFIKEGTVFLNGTVVNKTSQLVEESDLIELKKDHQYVGRGAHKIEGAQADFSLNFKDKVIADVGASTGGFTEFALKEGAKCVYAIDVGKDQLAEKLRQHPQVINLEGINIRHGADLPEKVDLAVVDLSYISLKHCLIPIRALCKDAGEMVVLVKPQFEVGRENIGKKGLVKSDKVARESLKDLVSWCKDHGLGLVDARPCHITGKTGNQEYFFYFKNAEVYDEKNGRLLWIFDRS